jgi:hypothetical protein
LLGDFNVKVGREGILKLAIGAESVHETGNDNEIRVVNFDVSKKLVIINFAISNNLVAKSSL